MQDVFVSYRATERDAAGEQQDPTYPVEVLRDRGHLVNMAVRPANYLVGKADVSRHLKREGH